MIVPHQQLAPETLRAVIEEVVTRSGTDYGLAEAALETKVKQVLGLLGSGKAQLVFDPETETCNVVPDAGHPAC